MNVTIKPELEKLIDLGEEYTAEEIDQMIGEGLDDIERGETIDGEEAFRRLRTLSAERRRQRA